MARDIKNLPKDLQKVFDNIMDKELLEEIAEWIRKTIYRRTKTGKGLSAVNRQIGGVANKEIDIVSPNYAKWREGKITGPYPASGRKSNLTFTGELLESMRAYVKNGQVIVEIPNERHSSGINMQKLLDYVEVENGRPFFGLSDTEMKTLDSMIARKLRERIRKLNKK